MNMAAPVGNRRIDVLLMYFTIIHFGVFAALQSLNETETVILLDKMLDPKVYDKRLRPFPRDGHSATIVSVDTYIRTISSIDELKMEFSVDLLIRMHWLDQRLAYPSSQNNTFITGGPTEVEKIWLPDLFFSNARHGYFHHLAQPNTMLRMFPTGELLYSIRYSLVLSCHMDLVKYPFDTQTCYIYLGSFRFTELIQIFKWKNATTPTGERKKPVSVNKDLKLPKFQLDHFDTEQCLNQHYTGNFSCLKLRITFSRQLGYHFTQSYIPNVLLVMASWISFWLDVDAVPARVTLGVTTLLTTTAQHKTIKDDLPPVSYTKAIDVWTGACTFFVFCALVEYAIVNVLVRREVKASYSHRQPAPATFREQNFYTPLSIKRAASRRSRTIVTTSDEEAAMGSAVLGSAIPEGSDKLLPLVPPDEGLGRSAVFTFDADIEPYSERKSKSQPTQFFKTKFTAKSIDVASRYVFPVAFFMFLAVYVTLFVYFWR